MNRNEFLDQMGRLIEVYGERAYPPERTEQIFKWASSRMERMQFQQLVSSLIANCERAPMLDKFKNAFIELGISKQVPKLECVYCDGTGWYCEGEGVPSAYRCRCPTGNSLPKYVPEWKGILEKRYPTPSELQVYADVRVKMQAALKEKVIEPVVVAEEPPY